MPFGAISAGTQLATSGTVVFSNSNSVTFGFSGSSAVTASYSGGPLHSFFNNCGFGALNVNLSTGTGLSIWPLDVGREATISQLTVSTFMLDMAATASQSTASGSMLLSLGIYTLNASTLSLLNSVATSITYAAVSNNSTAFSGQRWLTIHSSQWSAVPTVTGTNYWLGLLMSSSNQTQGFVVLGYLRGDSGSRQGTLGVASAGSSLMAYPFWGSMNTGGLPNSVQVSQMSSHANGGNFPTLALNDVIPSF